MRSKKTNKTLVAEEVAVVTRRRRRRRVGARSAGITLPLRSTRPRRRKRQRAGNSMGLSIYGKQFLQSVLAPYDFAQLGCGGVPDDFAGPTFTVVQRQLFTLSQTANNAFYAIMPTPQVGLWTCSTTVPTQSSDWVGTTFADQSVFPLLASGTSLIDSARVIGLTVEMKCMSPDLTVSGAVSVCRSEIRLERESVNLPIIVGAVTPGTVDVVGLASAAMGLTSSANYTGKLKDGFFAVARHMGPWTFSDKLGVLPNASNTLMIPNFGSAAFLPTDGTMVINGGSPAAEFSWFDNNMESLTFSIQGTAASPASFTFEVMMVIECRPAKNTVFAKVAAPSPPFDDVAIVMYKALSYNMPIAVMAKENARWWETLLALMKTGGYLASHIPGPIGGIGGGVQAIASGFEELFI